MILTDQYIGDCVLCDDLAVLEEFQRTIIYKSGETIFKQGTPANQLMWIEEGVVKIGKESGNNKYIIVRICSNREFIQLADLFQLNGNLHNTSAVAVTKVTINYIDKDVLSNLIEKNSKLATCLLNRISNENRILKEHLFSRSIKNLPGRVADVILYFYNLNNQKHEFEIPLSRVELAQFVSTTKESLIRTLSEFKNDKIINLDGRIVKINSLEIIKTLSYYG